MGMRGRHSTSQIEVLAVCKYVALGIRDLQRVEVLDVLRLVGQRRAHLQGRCHSLQPVSILEVLQHFRRPCTKHKQLLPAPDDPFRYAATPHGKRVGGRQRKVDLDSLDRKAKVSVPVAVGGHRVHRAQDRMCAADAERVGQASGDRCGRARGRDDHRGPAREGTRTRGARAAQGQRDSEAGQRVFRPGGARPPHQVLKAFVDRHRQQFGVESICRVLQIALSAYWRHAARQRNQALCSRRAQRDASLVPQVQRIWQANFQVYGADKVWRQLNREGVAVARCTVERLMRQEGLQGVRRGKAVRTTIPDPKAPCPLDRVNRQFLAERPNQLWVSDFTYVSTWQS